MSKTIRITKVFNISTGNSLDFNKMQVSDDGINFVSRKSKNNGVVEKVKPIQGEEPFSPGTISVPLGGSALCAHIQPEKYYTSQNMVVLEAKNNLSIKEKMFYVMCIRENQFRYSTFGREANRTIDSLKIPAEIPNWVYEETIPDYSSILKSRSKRNIDLNTFTWKTFVIEDLFEVQRGRSISKKRHQSETGTPVISALTRNNGLSFYTEQEPDFDGNCISIANTGQGSVGVSFYQPNPFIATNNVNVLLPRFEMDPPIGIFIATLLRTERYRLSFGRVLNLGRTKSLKIKLPVKNGNINTDGIREFMSSLNYSSACF